MNRVLLTVAVAAMLLLPAAYASAQTAPAQPIQPAPPESGSPTPTGAPATQGAGQSQGEQGRGRGGLFDNWMVPVALMGVLFLFLWMSGRSRRKQEAQRKQLLQSLKKGDKITTIGGIVGTIIEVRDNEVIVKTDENNNVRTRFARWAIRDVGEPKKSDTGEEKKV